VKVFVAGATGAIGRPLIKSLTLAGHTTCGMVRSQDSSTSLSNLV
jgi:2-alkyl-3-oxoalkanoate reductase